MAAILIRAVRTVNNHSEEIRQRVEALQESGDSQKERLAELYFENQLGNEKDIVKTIHGFEEGVRLARNLRNSWWELFFEGRLLACLTSDCHDFATAMPLALRLSSKMQTPEGRKSPLWAGVLTDVLYIFASVDAVGYYEQLESGFSELRQGLPHPPHDQRYVLDFRNASWLLSVERHENAYQLAQESLSIASRDNRTWFMAWNLFLLCRICYMLGRFEEVTESAELMLELSESVPGRERTKADAWLWRAAMEQMVGNDLEAARYFAAGMRVLGKLDRRDEISADPISAYYEYRGDYEAATKVRDRQIADCETNGAWHAVAIAYIERCRLRKLSESLTELDVLQAKSAFQHLKRPEWFTIRLDRAVAV